MDLSKVLCGRIATAISLFILSPIVLLQLTAFSEEGRISENGAAGVGMAVVLLFVAAGVALCIYNGLQLEKYKYLEQETFSLQYGVEGIVEKRKNDFAAKFRRNVIAGIMCYIVGAIPLLLTGVFREDELAMTVGVNILLVFVAAGVHLIVRVGIVQNSFNKLLQCEDYTVENKEIEKKLSYFPGSYWLIVTALYLGSGFYTGDWAKVTVLIWPVAGVLFAAVYIVLKAVARSADTPKLT